MFSNVESYSEDIASVSSFILFTCLQNSGKSNRRLFPGRTGGIFCCRFRPGLYSEFLSGSTAEFYIRPMLGYFDDVDLMMSQRHAIGCTDNVPRLPCDVRVIHASVICFEIIPDNKYPGYCHLKHLGYLKYDWKSEKYIFFPSEILGLLYVSAIESENPRLENRFSNIMNRFSTERATIAGSVRAAKRFTGPAFHVEYSKIANYSNINKTEYVFCIWCPHWPKQAAEWPSRSRISGWPTNVLIQNIVRHGCHLVNVSHPECPDDVRVIHLRLSFSHAEIMLIRSWTPIQQVFYHLLRHFAKIELIKKDLPKSEEVLTGYNMKTIMLWTCERKPLLWWESAPLIVLLSRVLLKLSKWLKRNYFPNYFMPQVNLLRQSVIHSDNFVLILQKLDQFSDSTRLNQWFLRNYVVQIYQQTFSTTRLNIGSREMTKCISRIKELTPEANFQQFFRQLLSIVRGCIYSVLKTSKKGRPLKSVRHQTSPSIAAAVLFPDAILHMTDLDHSSPFLPFGRLILLLYAEYAITCRGMAYDSEFIVDMIRGIPLTSKAMCLKSHNFPRSYRSKLRQSGVAFLRAQETMETITDPTNDAEFLVLSQISSMLLKQCLETKDDEEASDSVVCAATVYIASLHYAMSDFQTTVELCSLISLEPRSSECISSGSAKTLNAFCLLFIDDVARITGFFLLLKRIQDPSSYNMQPFHLLLRLTPQLFAEYLISSSTGNSPKYSNVTKRCRILDPLALDVLLILLTAIQPHRHKAGKASELYNFRRCVYMRRDLPDQIVGKVREVDQRNTTHLILQWSLKEMKTFEGNVLDKFGVLYHVADCYNALYLFNRGQYAEVTQLCHRILRASQHWTHEIHQMPCVMVIPPFHEFFDSDIQFLLGLQILCHFCFPLDSYRKPLSNFDACRQISAEYVQRFSTLHYNNYDKAAHQYFMGHDFVARYLLFKVAVEHDETRDKVYAAYRQINSVVVLCFECLVHALLCQRLKRYR